MPAGWWHISLKDNECPFQSALGLGFALEKTPAEDLAAFVAREFQLALEEDLKPSNLDPERAGHTLNRGIPGPLVELST